MSYSSSSSSLQAASQAQPFTRESPRSVATEAQPSVATNVALQTFASQKAELDALKLEKEKNDRKIMGMERKNAELNLRIQQIKQSMGPDRKRGRAAISATAVSFQQNTPSCSSSSFSSPTPTNSLPAPDPKRQKTPNALQTLSAQSLPAAPLVSLSSSSSQQQPSLPSIHPIQELPPELISEIFSHLDLASLAAACRVSKEWRELAGKPIIWKKVIYKEFAFSSKDWARELGEDAVKDEDRQEEFDSLPPIEEFRKAHAAFPGKKLSESHFLVRSPKTLCGSLSIRSLGQLFTRYFPNTEDGYRFIWDPIMNQHGDKATEKSCWLLGLKEPVPETRNKSYSVQQAMVAELAERSLVAYEVPEAVDIIICLFAEYIRSSKRILSFDSQTYTRCKDGVQYPAESGYFCQVTVGGFALSGPVVSSNDYGNDFIAVTALRKF